MTDRWDSLMLFLIRSALVVGTAAVLILAGVGVGCLIDWPTCPAP